MANILPIFLFYISLHVYFLFFDEEFLIGVTSALFYFTFYKIMGQSFILILFIKFLFVYINFNSIIYIGLKVTMFYLVHILNIIYINKLLLILTVMMLEILFLFIEMFDVH